MLPFKCQLLFLSNIYIYLPVKIHIYPVIYLIIYLYSQGVTLLSEENCLAQRLFSYEEESVIRVQILDPANAFEKSINQSFFSISYE